MKFIVAADTDIGISKQTNQDSVLIRHASSPKGEVVLAVVCDGMGGLQKGELASAVVIRAFSRWFDERMSQELVHPDMEVIAGKWSFLLKDLNVQIEEYSARTGVTMGTTCTAVLLTEDAYAAVHVGDTRLYYIDSAVHQLTEDQTLVAREIRRGNMTRAQAKTDKRRNMLLQCVGASARIEPQTLAGRTQAGTYMICSDGFRHEISDTEIYEAFQPQKMTSRPAMLRASRELIDRVKSRGERDNISVLLVRADKGE